MWINYGNFENRVREGKKEKKLANYNRDFNKYSLKIILYTKKKNNIFPKNDFVKDKFVIQV